MVRGRQQAWCGQGAAWSPWSHCVEVGWKDNSRGIIISFCVYIFLAHSRCFIQGRQGLSRAGVLAGPQAGVGGVLKPPVSFPGCRGLRFIQVFLQSICDGERDESHPNHIRVNATKAYEMALKKYHGWIVQKIFQVRPILSPGPGESLACGVHSPPCHSLAVAPWRLCLLPWAQEGLPCPCGGRLAH